MKKNILIIGAGGVASVASHKCAQNNHILGNIHIASRSIQKVHHIISSIKSKNSLRIPGKLVPHELDANDINKTIDLIRKTQSQIVINVGSPFINMSVLRACIETGSAYIDTALHEDRDEVDKSPPWYSNYEWQYLEECQKKNITAILSAGFDPGVVNAYAALAQGEYFDSIHSIDIFDINAGSHGKYFATNFDPEVNLREFIVPVWSWENRGWKHNSMFEIQRKENLPVVGEQVLYLTSHEEIHSLSKNISANDIRFWMGFSNDYINTFNVLNKIGLLSTKPIKIDGKDIIPIQFIKALLPAPSSLAPAYTGKTCIGNLVNGNKSGNETSIFIYNICDHKQCYAEVENHAIPYTAGVPPVAAAILVAQGVWDIGRMANVEELPYKQFIDLLNVIGLKTRIQDNQGDRLLDFNTMKTI